MKVTKKRKKKVRINQRINEIDERIMIELMSIYFRCNITKRRFVERLELSSIFGHRLIGEF
jgi:hypothetical protein